MGYQVRNYKVFQGLEMSGVAEKAGQVCGYRIQQHLHLFRIIDNDLVIGADVVDAHGFQTLAQPVFENRPVVFGKMDTALIINKSTE